MDLFNKLGNAVKSLLRNKRNCVLIAAILLLFVLLLIIACARSAVSEITLYYSPAESGAVLFKGDDRMSHVIPGRSVAAVKYSGDKSSCAVLMSEGSSYTLYFANGNHYKKIAANCTNSFVISYSGESVIFLNSEGKMSRYTAKRNRVTVIDENIRSFSLSPDGKTVLYSKNEGGAEKLYLNSGSASVLVSSNYTPLAVSDDAAYIYVLSADKSLCVLDKAGEMKAKLCSDADDSWFFFSADMSDVVFTDGAYTYVSHEGKSRIRLAPEKASPVADGDFTACNSDQSSRICASGDLTDSYYAVSDANGNHTLFFITEEHQRVNAAENANEYILLEKGRLVFKTSEGKVYSCKKGESTLLFDGAASIQASSDGKYIYYKTIASDLQVYHRGKIKKLASGVRSIYMTSWDELLFVLNDLRLYSVSKMRNAELMDENVYSCLCTDGAAFYCKNYNAQTGVFDLYSAEKKNRFSLEAEGMAWILP